MANWGDKRSVKQEELLRQCQLKHSKEQCERISKLIWAIGIEHEFFVGAFKDDKFKVFSNPSSYQDAKKPVIWDEDFSQESGHFIENATCTWFNPGSYKEKDVPYRIDSSVKAVIIEEGYNHPVYSIELDRIAKELHNAPLNELDSDKKEKVYTAFKRRCMYNRSVESISNEIMELDNSVKEMFEKYPNKALEWLRAQGKIMIWPFGGIGNVETYYNPDEMRSKIDREYAGSYHLSITLPHLPDETVDVQIERRNKFLRALQWLEPLFVSHWFGPDIKSMGDEGMFWEGSSRAQISRVGRRGERGGYGWAHFGDTHVPKKGETTEHCEEEKRRFCYEYADEVCEDKDFRDKCINVVKSEYMDSLREICEDSVDWSYYEDIAIDEITREYGSFEEQKNDEEKKHWERMVERRTEELVDETIDDCVNDPLTIVQSRYYDRCLEDEIRVCRNTYAEECHDRELWRGQISCEGALSEEREEFRRRGDTGVEIRIWDNFSHDQVSELWRHLILVAINAQEHEARDIRKDSQTKSIWDSAINAVVAEGYNTILSEKYIQALKDNLGLELKTNSRRAEDVYEAVMNELWAKYHDKDWFVAMSENSDEPLNFKKFNEQAFDWNTRYKLRTSPSEIQKWMAYLSELRVLSDNIKCDTPPCFVPLRKEGGELKADEELELVYKLLVKKEPKPLRYELRPRTGEEAYEFAKKHYRNDLMDFFITCGYTYIEAYSLIENVEWDGLPISVREGFRYWSQTKPEISQRPMKFSEHIVVKNRDIDVIWVSVKQFYPSVMKYFLMNVCDLNEDEADFMMRQSVESLGVTFLQQFADWVRDRYVPASIPRVADVIVLPQNKEELIEYIEQIEEPSSVWSLLRDYYPDLLVRLVQDNVNFEATREDVLNKSWYELPESWSSAMANIFSNVQELEILNAPSSYFEPIRGPFVPEIIRPIPRLDVTQLSIGDAYEYLRANHPEAIVRFWGTCDVVVPLKKLRINDNWSWEILPDITKNKFQEWLRKEIVEGRITSDLLKVKEPSKLLPVEPEEEDFVTVMHRTMGGPYTKEDVRDVLDFLERHNVIEVKRSPKGLIKEVRPLYQKSEVERLMKIIAEDTDFKINKLVWKVMDDTRVLEGKEPDTRYQTIANGVK